MPNKQIKNKVEQHGPPHSPIHLLAAAKLLVQNHSCLGPQAVKQKVCIAQWWLDMSHSLNYSCGGHAAGPIVVAWWIVWDVCVCVCLCCHLLPKYPRPTDLRAGSKEKCVETYVFCFRFWSAPCFENPHRYPHPHPPAKVLAYHQASHSPSQIAHLGQALVFSPLHL